jgi:hypothetical protein
VRTACAGWLCGVGLLIFTGSAMAEPSPASTAGVVLAPRLSPVTTATEYWDVTAWLDSGERVVARFLVTNQGPGTQTAAAVGHVVLANGDTLPFKWGRLRDAWTLDPDRGRLKIAKAALVLRPPTIVVSVRSPKHGVELRLEIDRPRAPISIRSLSPGYPIDVALPAPAHGEISGRSVRGVGAVTHTAVEATEAEIIARRVEVFASGDGGLGMYVVELTLADGTRKSAAYVARGATIVAADPITLERWSALPAGGDARYPLPAEWSGKTAALLFQVAIGRELLRMNPLDLLPQPFRLLLSLGARPQRVWADARVTLDFGEDGEGPADPTEIRGLVAATFAQPER